MASKSNYLSENLNEENTLVNGPFDLILLVVLSMMAMLPLICSLLAPVFPTLSSDLSLFYRFMLILGLVGWLLGAYVLMRALILGKSARPFKEWFQENGLVFFMILFLICCCISTALSDDFARSWYGNTYMRDGLLSYFAYAGFFIMGLQLHTEKQRRFIFNCFAGSAAFIAFLIVVLPEQQAAVINLFGERANFYNVNHYGYYLSLTVPMSVALFVSDKDYPTPWNWLVYTLRIVSMGLLSYSLIRARSLGPLIGVVCGLILLLVLYLKKNRDNWKKLAVAAAVVLIVGGITSAKTWDIVNDVRKSIPGATLILGEVRVDKTEQSAGSSSTTETSESTVATGSGRASLWYYAGKFMLEKPWFGYGPENLNKVYGEADQIFDRPHNEYLQFGASLGIPALSFYIAAMVMLCLLVHKKFRNASLMSLGAFCAVISYLIQATFGNTMFYSSPFFFLILGLTQGAFHDTSMPKLIEPVKEKPTANSVEPISKPASKKTAKVHTESSIKKGTTTNNQKKKKPIPNNAKRKKK